MSQEEPRSSGGFAMLCTVLLLALPIGYIASSGPVLATVSKKQMLNVNGAPFRTNVPRYPNGNTLASGFYSPLFRAATTVHLEPKLYQYLRWSGVTAVPVCSYQVMILPARPTPPASKR